MRIPLSLALVAAVLVTVTPTTAVANETAPGLRPFYDQPIRWEACPGRGARVECASVTVPLDYSQPTGRTIDLALLRTPASGTARGSIVVNPGGPGEGGLDFAQYLATVMDPDLAAAYDIVGFDPRGVDRSAPVVCMTGKQTTAWYRTDMTPDTVLEREALLDRASQISRGCLRRDPTLSRFIGTDNTVRDMDVIRSVLGEDRLNWIGFSYGTVLGAKYAEEYPERVGRIVLDGGVDPSLDAMAVSRDQSRGFQLAMARFAADCARRNGCVADTRAGVLAFINSLLRTLDSTPLPTDGRRDLVQAEALSALFFGMYTTDLWPTLRTGLRDAKNGDGTTLQLLAQLWSDQTGPNRYGSNGISAFYAISCWDYPPTPGEAGLQSAARQWSQSVDVPEMARAMSWGNAPCSTWLGHSPEAPAPVSSATTAPILVIGTVYDPATPYAWSQALTAQLPTSRLLTRRGDGHTAYADSNRCIDDLTNRYLLTGVLPAAGTTCSG